MTTLDHNEILQAIRETDPAILMAKLANADERQGLFTLDHDLGGDMIATRAAIESIPPSYWATHSELMPTLQALVAMEHPKTFRAVADKLVGFSMHQINAHPWLREFINDGRVTRIPQVASSIQAVNDRLTEVHRLNSLKTFVGPDVTVDDSSGPLDSIDQMSNDELVKAVLDTNRRTTLLAATSTGSEGAGLVVHALHSIPAREWERREDLVEDFKEILTSKIPVYAEVITGIIEGLPDATVMAIGEKSPSGPHPFVELTLSPDFRSTYGSEKLAPRITQAVHAAQARTNAAKVLSTPGK